MTKPTQTTGRTLECDGVSYRIRQTATDGDMGFGVRFAPVGQASDYEVFVTQKMADGELRGIIRFGWEMHKIGHESGYRGAGHTAELLSELRISDSEATKGDP